MDVLILVLVVIVVLAGLAWFSSARGQADRAVSFSGWGDQEDVRRAGLTMLIPVVDRMKRVNMQVVTTPVPAQDGINRDNVTVRVDTVVYFRVIDPVSAVVQVQDYGFAISQVAQTSLRSIIGKSELDDLLSNRERLNQGLEVMPDSPAASWGIEIDRVEIKDVALPESMKRSMSRQAEAERERRSRIINGDGEFQASQRLSEAAAAMAETRAATTVTRTPTTIETTTVRGSSCSDVLGSLKPTTSMSTFSPLATSSPRPTPTADAAAPSMTASSSRLRITWRRVAPMARSNAISRERCVTIIVNVFQMMKAPTKSAMPAKIMNSMPTTLRSSFTASAFSSDPSLR